MTDTDKARLLALLVPAALLGGALGSQYIGGLYPCHYCYLQRYGHYAAVALAILSFVTKSRPGVSRLFLWLALLGIASSGAIGVYHAGVEKGIFAGIGQCTALATSGTNDDILKQIMAAPLVRCDQIQFSFLGISMAGWNAILSLGTALILLCLLLKRQTARR